MVMTTRPASRQGDGAHPAQRGVAQRLRARRAMTLLILSAVAPGSAQLLAGHRGLGRVVLRAWAVLVTVAVLLALAALLSRQLVLSLLVRPSVLLAGYVLLPAVALVWAGLLVDAWRLGRPRSLGLNARRAVAGAVAVLLVAGTGPLLIGAHYAAVQRDLVTSVFADGEVTTTDGRMNVLLLGGDAGSGRVGLRPDSITLASIDAATGDAALLSLPRNLERAPFPEGSPAHGAFPDGFDGMLNATYTYGSANPELFPAARDPGIEATRAAVEATLGLPVHYHVLVDLNGFRDLVDALGGIEMRVARRVPIGGGTSPVTGYIEPGLQRLDGYHALWYARSREGSSDYERMGRQRCILAAIARRADPVTALRHFRAIAGSAERLLDTNLPQQALPGLVELALRARESGIRSVQFVPPMIDTGDPDVARIRTLAAAAVEGGDALREAMPEQTGTDELTGPAAEIAAETAADTAAETADAPDAADDAAGTADGNGAGPADDAARSADGNDAAPARAGAEGRKGDGPGEVVSACATEPA